MLTKPEQTDWDDRCNSIPRETVLDWLYELHGRQRKLENVVWIEDFICPVVTYIVDTHCCCLDLNDPPAWFVYRMLKHRR
jgi:hypothetical protein